MIERLGCKRVWTFFAYVAYFASFAINVLEASPTKLELNWKPGEIRKYALKTSAEQRPAVQDSLQAASLVMNFSTVVRLSAVAVDGEGTMNVAGHMLKLEVGMKMGDLELDTDGLPMVADLKEQLLRQTLTASLTRQGVLKEGQMPEVDRTGLATGPTFFGDAGLYAKRTLESFLQYVYGWLPDKDVAVGDTWTRTIQSGVVTDPPLTFQMVHRFEGIEKIKGQECAKIITMIEVPETLLAEGAYKFSGSGQGVTLFMIKKGRTLSSKSTVKVLFTGKDQPATLESVVTTSIDAQ